MRKLIICDKNPEIIEAVNKLLADYGEGVFNDVQVIEGDVIKVHEYTPGSKIVTASNPKFSPDGGLDAVLAKKYDWNPKEFSYDDHLFYVVSVDNARKSSREILLRSAVGILGYSSKFIPILTGIGTGVGGVAIELFVEILKAILSNLSSADLRFANLSSANLSFANLSFANLSFANLSSADLRYADLRSANLSFANLSFANLSSANLSFANLSSADLRYADLRSANLRSARNAPYQWHCQLNILRMQKNKLIAYKFINTDGSSPVNTSKKITYIVGKTYKEEDFNSDDMQDCGSGINLATLEWCERERSGRPIIEVEFDPKDIVSIPYVSDGKFRVKKCKVLRQLTEVEVRKLIKKTRSYEVEVEK